MSLHRLLFRLAPLCIVLGCELAVFGQDSLEVNFATEVRPILSDKCFKCHGPDAGQRATELRLDVEESVHEYAVEPGKPDTSELILRIETEDPDKIMPPPEAKVTLTATERDVLRKWIAGGAKFSKHWSFEPVKPVPIPKLDANSPWKDSNNPIDGFVGQRLEKEKLTPSPISDSTTLARRLSLDLIGLPPSEKQLDEYRGLIEANRYSELVDLLLAMPQFGERWAIDWLDVARYADTHGYQNDRYRATWPWRDWVIESLNQNMPFDQFITWQLAGDLLPNATREQILATAFNRLHRQTNEGGSVEEEFRTEYVSDRVNTFGAAFLGLTLECAKCHDHKYDPISQREYYELAAFFNNIDESGLYSHFTDAVPTPALQLSSEEQSQRVCELREQILAKSRQLLDFKIDDPKDSNNPSAAAPLTLDAVKTRLGQGQIAHYSFETTDEGKFANTLKTESRATTLDNPEPTTGAVGKGLLLNGENNVTMSEGGQWERNQPFSFSLWLRVPRKFERCVILHRSRAWSDSASRGYELLIEDGKLSAALIHFWPGNAVRIVANDPLPLDRWCQVIWTYDGSSQATGMQLWIDGSRIQTTTVRDQLTQAIKGDESKDVTLGQRFRDVGFKNGSIDELRIFDRQLSDVECKYLYWQDSAQSPQQIDQQFASFAPAEAAQFHEYGDADRQKLAAELFELREQLSKLSDPIPEIMVMKELPGSRPTFILRRGSYDAPVQQVERGVINGLLPLSTADGNSPNRLDLAKWLTDTKHPLTARVAVNRLWQTLFGRGLVATTEDFGLQGAFPTHADLLDWMALHYMNSGWDTKSLIKLIVSSNTYRQSSNLRAELIQDDPENLLLARGPAVRLSAELLRDAALYASGLLVDKLGGPPVKPYQPEGLWEEKSGESYKRDQGEGSRRRSLYTFWKRTSPPPMMMTFDASNREVCVVRRQSTLTPLQTLVVLNDPQFVETARALAQRVMLEHDKLPDQLSYVFLGLTSRKPSEAELNVLTQMFAGQLQCFESEKDAATKFLSVGDHKPDATLSPNALAALTAVAEGLMSYDEFVMKR